MKKNSYLVEYSKAQVGKPYWFGTFGQTASAKLLAEKKKQYPKYYTAKDFEKQFGQRVHDCVGLHNGALWSETPTSAPKYNASQDLGADGLYRKAKKKGAIKTFDKVEGRLVFKGTASKKTHVGIYSAGYVYEAKGHAYGVKKTKFSASSWPYWAQSPFFEEDHKSSETPAAKPAHDPTPSIPKEDPKTVVYKVTAIHGLRIRKEPNTNSDKNILIVMSRGSNFKVDKTEKGWAHGTYKGTSGWASLTYLKKG